MWHDSLRKSINGAFLPAAVVQYEHLVDSTIDTFLTELDKRFAEKPGSAGSIDFHPWLFVCFVSSISPEQLANSSVQFILCVRCHG